jgi:hypothetical protein
MRSCQRDSLWIALYTTASLRPRTWICVAVNTQMASNEQNSRVSAAARAFLALADDPSALKAVLDLGVADAGSIRKDPRDVVSTVAQHARDLMIKWSFAENPPEGSENNLAYFMTVFATHYVAAMEILVDRRDEHLSAALSLPLSTFDALDRRAEGLSAVERRRASPTLEAADPRGRGDSTVAGGLACHRPSSLCG